MIEYVRKGSSWLPYGDPITNILTCVRFDLKLEELIDNSLKIGRYGLGQMKFEDKNGVLVEKGSRATKKLQLQQILTQQETCPSNLKIFNYAIP